MIEAKETALESLQVQKVYELIRSPGPCITLFLPPTGQVNRETLRARLSRAKYKRLSANSRPVKFRRLP
jgi:hypothetical protein